jgi:hypothetical protein
MLFRLFLAGFLLLTTLSIAQKRKQTPQSQSQATSIGPYYPDANKYIPKKKKGANGITYESQNRFYDQLEVVARQKRKIERTLESPAHSNPAYFGHKRQPKKHSPDKMKFCKVCGIRH